MLMLKPIAEIRKPTLKTGSLSWHVWNLAGLFIDFDVYLPTLDCNLQVPYFWDLELKRDLIMSVIYERPIPPVAFVELANDTFTLQVIDGKQRLMTLLDFYENKFSIVLESQEFLYQDLPSDYKIAIKYFAIKSVCAYEEPNKPISDLEKVEWFRKINYNSERHNDKLNEIESKIKRAEPEKIKVIGCIQTNLLS